MPPDVDSECTRDSSAIGRGHLGLSGAGFVTLLDELKGRIQSVQARAIVSVNSELVRLYWDVGRIINQRQEQEAWGAAVIPRLAHSPHNELPDLKGFSERCCAELWSRAGDSLLAVASPIHLV